ncbi:MAG: outer membrane protein transport protein [Chitinophagaceae bacterium]
MKKLILFTTLSLCVRAGFAQVPEDALKFGWFGPNGTARAQAIGGAVGALGADISATYSNPAGLAFYKTRDFVISPGFSFLNNNSNFRGDSKTDSKSFFNLGTSGFVFGSSNNFSKWNGGAFSIAVSTIANFNSRISYTGKNNFSSYGEQYAAEAASSGIDINSIPGSTDVSIGTRLAAYTYLIDTLTIPGNNSPDVVSMAQWDNLRNKGTFLVSQQNTIVTTGGITEIALGFAGTRLDKLYLGGSLGIPIVNYTKNSVLTETDISGNNNNNFEHSTLTETYTTKGVGLNVKLGAIYRPTEALRIGLAVHSPSFYGLKDTYYATMTTNTENYVHNNNSTITASSDQTLQTYPQYKYDLSTPWRFMLSGAYVINGVEDVKQQRGFITADVEYITYKTNKYRSAEEVNDNTYYNGVNQAIKAYYKNAFNFRVGGEVKFNTIMARLGFSYYMTPYNDTELKANRMFVSGGLGYRNKGIFFDIAYVYGVTKDVNFPYRLPDKANTFANVKGTSGNIAATIGLKF